MIEEIDAILENFTGLGIFLFIIGGSFFCVIACIMALVILANLAIRWLIRYSVRRIRRWFVENVLLPKVRTEHTSFRKAH
jgi:hypothetical protein